MSVLQQLSDNLNRNTLPPDTQTYLAGVHKSMIARLKQNSNLTKEKNDAKKLESFLNLLKAKQLSVLKETSINENAFSPFWDKMDQISLLNELEAINPELIYGLNFINSGSSSYGLGAELEIGMARLVKSFEAMAQGIKSSDKEYEKLTAGTGSRQVSINTSLEQMVNDIEKEELQRLYRLTAQELGEYNQKDVQLSNRISMHHTVSGKIDTVGLSANLIISSECSSMGKDIIEILKGASFTEKNYISTNDLHLGQTNPVRVFATVNAGEPHLGTRYFRMRQCFISDQSEHPESPKYFYRIRAIYELTGVGMKYKYDESSLYDRLTEAGYAKYLVWNNPFGGIRVIPTRQIVNNIFEQAKNAFPSDWRDALYGPIELNQITLSNI